MEVLHVHGKGPENDICTLEKAIGVVTPRYKRSAISRKTINGLLEWLDTPIQSLLRFTRLLTQLDLKHYGHWAMSRGGIAAKARRHEIFSVVRPVFRSPARRQFWASMSTCPLPRLTVRPSNCATPESPQNFLDVFRLLRTLPSCQTVLLLQSFAKKVQGTPALASVKY